MKRFSIVLALVLLFTLAQCQTEYELEQEPWKYDTTFDEDAELDYARIALYAPKGCGLDEMQGLKDWIDNDSAKFPDLEMFSKSGDPYLRFFDKNGNVTDDIPVERHDPHELNKLLISLGVKYDKSLTWELRKQENKLKKAFYAPDIKEDL